MNKDLPLPIYLPSNEPYLGSQALLEFDQAIPPAMDEHIKIGLRTFSSDLTPLQICATEIIPQGVSIALSIRELIRQAYLYSAGILIRPLVERTGTIYYLNAYPDAVIMWENGWPRKSQPSLKDLLEILHPARDDENHIWFKTMLNKLIHSDPEGAAYNMFVREDGVPVFSSGKIIDQPKVCDFISIAGKHYLERLVSIAGLIFPPTDEAP